MRDDRYRVEAWNRADTRTKIAYWKVMNENYNVLEDENVNRESISSLDSIYKPVRVTEEDKYQSESENENMFDSHRGQSTQPTLPPNVNKRNFSESSHNMYNSDSGLDKAFMRIELPKKNAISAKAYSENSEDFDDIESKSEDLNDFLERKKKEDNSKKLSKIQIYLWINTDDREALSVMWFEELNNQQRIIIWNELPWPEEYFDEGIKLAGVSTNFFNNFTAKTKNLLKKKKQRDASIDQSQNSNFEIENLSFEKLSTLATRVVHNVNTLSINYKNKTQAEYAIKLYKKLKSVNDLKSPLWMPLTLEEKISLAIQQKSTKQFGLMILLIMKQYEDDYRQSFKTDQLIVSNLKNLIYDKYSGT